MLALPNVTAQANSLTTEKTTLGEKLFFDKRLSQDGTVSCASCHDPAAAFTNKNTLAIGVSNQRGARNAPTLLNSVFSTSYFWDGRAEKLEEQAKQPLLNAIEMGMDSEAALVERISAIDEYRKTFRRVFPRDRITLNTIASAIAAYERTLVSRNSPFDRFIAGDKSAISEAQKRGWELFKGKAKCIDCHAFSSSSPFFTDYKFYNTGVGATGVSLDTVARKIPIKNSDAASLAHQREFSDLGRFLVTRKRNDIGAFKTPTLRDVELTGPYMHNGSIKTLLEVLKFYNDGGIKNPHLHAKMQPLHLTEPEINYLSEFLRALTSDDVLRMVQSTKPQTRAAKPLN